MSPWYIVTIQVDTLAVACAFFGAAGSWLFFQWVVREW